MLNFKGHLKEEWGVMYVVNYTAGMFVTLSFSLAFFFPFQMPEEQAFCVLKKILFDYGMRNLFKQGFEELHLKFYQLERLIQVGAFS